MHYQNQNFYTLKINIWDLFGFLIIFGLIASIAIEAMSMAKSYQIGQNITVNLALSYLPHYAIRSVIRIILAMCLSLCFTFTIGTLAAKSTRAEHIILPMIDILQSIPVLSFMSIALLGFIRLFPNSLLGPETASIFVIFTSQAWNMTLSFYQSIRTVPLQLKEVAYLYGLSSWKTFWIVEVPYAMPSLLWNMMVSMSASWFFVVASEAIEISDQSILLPGIGSYIAVAIHYANLRAVFFAVCAMLIVILIYDQLIFRPLVYWADKFKTDKDSEDKLCYSWFMRLLERTHFLKMLGLFLNQILKAITHFNCPTFKLFPRKKLFP